MNYSTEQFSEMCRLHVLWLKNAPNGKRLYLSNADLSNANLSNANLRYANLSDANLSDANLIIITWSFWTTYITPGYIRIGCQSHDLESWKNFDDDQIADMDSRALDFWKQNKELIVGLCERFEVKNTGDENE